MKNPNKKEIHQLKEDLISLAKALKHSETKNRSLLKELEPSHHLGAINLIHYLGLRQKNLQNLQIQLSQLGLSSLGRSEAYVMPAIEKVLERLGEKNKIFTKQKLNFAMANKQLALNTQNLFGYYPENLPYHIIVTAPDGNEITADWIEDLLKAGMTCLRINCAHGNSKDWKKTAQLLRTTAKSMKKNCSIMMDLAGPKLRTQISNYDANFQIWKPKIADNKDNLKALKIHITASEGYPILSIAESEMVLPLSSSFLVEIKVGDCLELKDSRGKSRKIHITHVSSETGIIGKLNKNCFLELGLNIHLKRNNKVLAKTKINKLYTKFPFVELSVGDTFSLVDGLGRLTNKQTTKKRVDSTSAANSSTPQVVCSIPSVFNDIQKGERILFDDGKIETIVQNKNTRYLNLKVIRGPKDNFKLKNEKGINFPDSDLSLQGLTNEDRENLNSIVEIADIVSLSFIKDKSDIQNLRKILKSLNKDNIGLVLKIETQSGFRNLPSILFEAMKHPNIGVMIARGDLAVEVGFERLAEVQEEILWLCEAAHLPVIWATQVLENLAKTGLPSRAEITDAAMSSRAEAVMLNKGPYIKKAVDSLVNILGRMRKHQNKKRSLLKELRVSKIPLDLS